MDQVYFIFLVLKQFNISEIGGETFRKTPVDVDDSLSKMLATHNHYQFNTQRVNHQAEDNFEEK